MVSNPLNYLDIGAIETAEFLQDIETLFDSFIDRTPKPELGRPYRRCMSNNSPHSHTWFNMKNEIKCWQFISENVLKNMPFKFGWLTLIDVTCQLREVCREKGFKFLRTRSLHQDPLENLLSLNRHLGDQNVNPHPYKLISCMKTSVLNNLLHLYVIVTVKKTEEAYWIICMSFLMRVLISTFYLWIL